MSKLVGFCNFEKNKDFLINRIKKTGNHYIDNNNLFFIDYNHNTKSKFYYNFQNNIIILDGEIYNREDIKNSIKSKGYSFDTQSDEELILKGYLCFGIDILNKLNGVYCFCIYDNFKKQFFMGRDRLGVCSLFFNFSDKTLFFSTEVSDIFMLSDLKPAITKTGLNEILSIGPSRTHGIGIFKDVYEIKPGNFLIFTSDFLEQHQYWDITAYDHKKTYETTKSEIYDILIDSIKMQTKNSSNICSMMSGGLDSSIVTGYISKNISNVNTFSFDYEDNSQHFKSNNYQPDQDRPWVLKMIEEFKTNHKFLVCDNTTLVKKLDEAVDAKGLPGMADIDSSLLYFCQEISKEFKIAFSGECGDEVFGGYPWFHRQELISSNTFPWSKDHTTRKFVFDETLLNTIKFDEYIQNRYNQIISKAPLLDAESDEAKKNRQLVYLTYKSFMSTLVYRLEKISKISNLTVRVPFADYRLLQYLYNVPLSMKAPNGVVKGLLRDCFKNTLPQDLLYRKKSPYPKTYNPNYENLLKEKLNDILSSSNEPIKNLINSKNIHTFLDSSVDYGTPWYGQLMAAPQMMAYLIQINYWLKKFDISIIL